MIKQIKNINNVSCYREFSSGGSIQFERLTFIYGLNTRGKSTLTDILTSLKENDPTLITSRKSIPPATTNQSVKISIRPFGATNQVDCIFSNTSWTQVDSNECLHIFTSDFIHKNLFTGLSIERQNKENFTTFVLGQQGVQLATEIADDKRLLRQKRSALPNFLPLFLNGKPESEWQPFLSIDIAALNIEEMKSRVAELDLNLRQEQQRLERPSEILQIPDVSPFSVPPSNLPDLTYQTNDLLEREFSEISSIAIAKLHEHIENNFETTENAEQWIKEGLDARKDDSENCSFCGQSLENAQDLINVYHAFFNQAYREYISDVSGRTANLRRQWVALSFNSLNTVIANQSLLTQYSQLINAEAFTTLMTRLNELIQSANEADLNDLSRRFSQDFNLAFSNKERRPHEKIESINFSSLIESQNNYYSRLSAISETIESIREAIRIFKEPYRNLTQIRTKISGIEAEIKDKKRLIARFEQDDSCVSYESEKRGIAIIEDRITNNEQELSTNQNQYLDDFFTRIDFHFKQFGSENFALERGTDNRGHQPVYYLKIKFKGVDINDTNIGKVFSESDKRALALSVFWAKIDFLTSEQKSKAIIVLDDPVTSFDDNRILKSITRIKDTIAYVSQVIVLTHYSHFIKNFMERGMNDAFPVSFIEIAQDNNTSFLRKIEGSKLTATTYDKIFSKIQAFINRESEEDIRSDLRPFLESQYLPHFYINEFKSYSASSTPFGTLSDKIEAIFIDQNVKAKFHEFRTMLNPDSHLFTSSNEEDIRNFASEMMNYLYNFSHN